MKVFGTICAIILSCVTQVGYAATTYTATVNGIKWTYTVSNGKVSLGGGFSSSPAVSTSTTGAITIPSELGGYPVTSIGSYAFSGCSGLTSVTIPNSVTSIGSYASFSGCSGLTSVTIPASVTSIGEDAFRGCSGLMSFVVDTSNPNYKAVNGLLLSKDGKTVVAGVNGDVTIPDSVTSIGSYAFYGCSGLTSVTIPDSVTSVGYAAFYECSGLTSVTIGDSVTSIGSCAFRNCNWLTSVTMQGDCPAIGSHAFYGVGSSCKVYLPEGNDTYSVVDGKWQGMSVGYHNTQVAYSIVDGTAVVDGLVDDAAGEVVIPQILGGYPVTAISSGAFKGCSGLTSVTIPDGVTSIGSFAFYCSGLTSVTIPDGVTSIGSFAFFGCSGLTSVTIPSRVTNIGEMAFYCSGLTSVTIPDSVTSIGNGAFSGCSGLTSVTIPDSVTSIGSSAFSDCSGLTSVTIGNGVTSIGDYAFYSCRWLTSVTIPDSVTSIGDDAFYGCSGLTSVTMEGDCPTVGTAAFSDVASHCMVRLPVKNGTYTVVNGKWMGMIVEYYGKVVVTFDANNGVGGWSGMCDCGMAIVAPTVTRIGYAFKGWTPNVAATVPANDVTYTAQWAINQYTVTFDANGGEGGTSANQDYGTAIVAPTVTRTGYTFKGWSPSVEATVPAENVTYVAQWDINKYTVTFDANGGEGGMSQLVEYGSGLAMPTVLRKDYDLVGWFTAASGGSLVAEGTAVMDAMTLYAHWELKPNTWLYDVADGKATITSYSSPIGDIVIPSEIDGHPVTAIGANAFKNCVDVRSVAIPGSVLAIGQEAFANCRGLEQLIVPDSVRNIGERAFYFTGMESVVIGNGVTNIGDYAFYDCTFLSRLIIGENVQSIGAYSFANIYSLSKVVIPDSVITIGDHAFEKIVSLSEVVVGRGVRYIGDGAFSGSEAMEYIGRIIFNGDAPQLGANVFPPASSNCRIYVRYGSSGWGVDIPGRWGVGVSDPAEVADISGSGWYGYKVPASEDEFVFVFTNAGRTVSFTPKTDVSVKEVFVLGGGGGGGPGGGGGGGGESLWITNAVDYTAGESGTSVYVGRGGSGGDVRYSSSAVRASSSSNGSTSYVMMKNPRNPSVTDQYQGYGGHRGGFFYRDYDSYSAGYGAYWGGGAGGGSALVTAGHLAGDSVMNAAGRTYGRADYGSGFGGAAVDGAPGGGGGGGLRGIATGGGNYADEGARKSVVYAGSDGADGTGGIAGGKGGDGFPISILGDSPIRVAIGNLTGRQDAWLGGGGGGGSGRNRSGYSEMWGVGAESPGEGGRGGGGRGGLYTAGTYYNYLPGLGKDGAPFTGGGGGGGSFMEPVTNASSTASNWILGGGKGADGFVVMLVKVKSGGGNGWPIDYVHHNVTLDANGGECAVGSVSVAEGPLSDVLPAPTRKDAAFLGWFTELEGGEKVDSSTMVLDATTFYAHWLFDVAAPQIVSESGAEFYTDSCMVTITCATPGASIYYTDDGSTPKINEHYLYTGPITIAETTTIKAFAAFEGAKSAYATVTITKKALTLADALDVDGDVVIGTDTAFPWKSVLDSEAKEGDSSARSGAIGDRADTWMSATVSGAGTLSFWCKVSCEHDDDNTFTWDRLMVYTNGVEITDWRMDGETDWTLREVSFAGGENTVKWVYYKDKSYSEGEDCAWVDGVTWTPRAMDVSVDMGGGKSVVVPGEWLAAHKTIVQNSDGDIATALKSKAANGRLSVVECYLLGLDPEKPDDDFKITSFSIKADGSLDLDAITFSPPQSQWNIQGATPRLKGKAKLSDLWQDVPSGGDPSFRFFTIAVELP